MGLIKQVSTAAEIVKRIEWIRKNGREYTAAEIADLLKCTRGSIHALCRKRDLIIKTDPLSRHLPRVLSHSYSEDIFNVHARENWMI